MYRRPHPSAPRLTSLLAPARRAALALAPLGLSAGVSLAGASVACSVAYAQDWSYEVSQQVTPGQSGHLTFRPPMPLKDATVTLTSGKTQVVKRERLLSDKKPYKLTFKPPAGSSEWVAEVRGKDAEGLEQSVSFNFTVLSAGALKAQVDLAASSLETGALFFDSNRPLTTVELEAFGDEGQRLWGDNLSFKEQGKDRYAARFEQRDEVPRRLELKVYDAYDSWFTVRLVRWYAEVPHEDVLFESGSAELRPSELPKMNAAITAVEEELNRFRRAMGDEGAAVDLQLYVGGYTDTVGDANDNLKLSQARARAIAQHFKRQGVPIPVFFAGFGERGLLIKTPDSADEARNRRAVYVVANAPPAGESFPSASWSPLR